MKFNDVEKISQKNHQLGEGAALVIYAGGRATLPRKVAPDKTVLAMAFQVDQESGEFRLKQDVDGAWQMYAGANAFYWPASLRSQLKLAKGSPAVIPLCLADDGWWYGQLRAE